MSGQFGRSAHLRGCWVDRGNAAAAVTHDELAGASIGADIIGIAAEIDCTCGAPVFSIVKPHGAVAGIGDGVAVAARRDADPLRFGQPGQLRRPNALRQVEDVNGVVAKLRDQQTVAGQIDRQMVDPPSDAVEDDLAVRNQRLGGGDDRRYETDERRCQRATA